MSFSLDVTRVFLEDKGERMNYENEKRKKLGVREFKNWTLPRFENSQNVKMREGSDPRSLAVGVPSQNRAGRTAFEAWPICGDRACNGGGACPLDSAIAARRR